MIAIPNAAGKTVQLAEQELAHFAPALQAAGVHICLRVPGSDQEEQGAPRAPGHADGYTIAGNHGSYVICSKSERGLLYGAYGFLEALGAAWPHPGESRLPAWERWPDLDLYVEPSYDLRGTSVTGPTTTAEVETLLVWSGRRGLNALHIANNDSLDLVRLDALAQERGVALTTGPLAVSRPTNRCYRHSIGNPYGCETNRPIFAGLAGGAVAAAGYGDLGELGRPANLVTVIRQDLEDLFRESYRAFFMIHNGPISWWTSPLNFDVYARTLWDLNTDPAELLMAFAADDELVERSYGMAEEAAAAALCQCCSTRERAAAVAATAELLREGLERSLHVSHWSGALAYLEAMAPEQRGCYGTEVLLPALRQKAGGVSHD